MAIASYISSHGYGHAGRQQALIKALAEADIPVYVRSAAPAKFFDLPGVQQHVQAYDVGVIQPSALRVDPAATCRAYGELMAQREAIIAQELQFLREKQINLIIADMPPIAFAIAEAAGLPSVAITHFTWDWVYTGYLPQEAGFAPIIAQIRADYGRASLALRLPFAHAFDMFPHVEEMPLLVNPVIRQAPEIKAALLIPPDKRLALLSMGGHSWEGGDFSAIPAQSDWVFLVMPDIWPQVADYPNVRVIPYDFPNYHDLIAAADVVIGKAGGATVAECLAHRTAMLYTLRDDYRENSLLDDALQEHIHSQRISQMDLQSGVWISQLNDFLARPFQWPNWPTDGVTRIRDRLLQLLSTS